MLKSSMRSKSVSMAVMALLPLLFHSPSAELFEFPKILFLYLSISVYLVWVGFDLIRKKSFQIITTPLLLVSFIWIISSLFSTFFALHLPTAIFGYYTRWTGGLTSIICYVLLIQIFSNCLVFPEPRRMVLKAIWLSLCVIVIYALLQKLGIDKGLWAESPQARVFSTFGQPNWLSSYLVAFTLPLLIFLREEQDNIKRFLQFLFVSMLVAIGLTYSVSGFVGLVIAVGIYLLLLNRSKVKRTHLLGFLLSAALLIGGVAISPKIYQRIKDTGSIRLIVWQASVTAFRNSPIERKIIGFGPGNFAYAFLPYRPVELNNTVEWDFLFNKPHNEFLDILINQGLIGLVWMISWIGLVTYITLHPKKDSNLPTLYAYYAGFISLIVTSFFGFLVIPTTLALVYLSVMVVIEGSFYQIRDISFVKGNLKGGKIILGSGLIIFGMLAALWTVRYFIADYHYAQADDLGGAGFTLLAIQELETATKYNTFEPRYQSSLGYYLTQLAKETKEPVSKNDLANLADSSLKKAFNMNPHNSIIIRSVLYSYLDLGDVDKKYFGEGIILGEKSQSVIPTDSTIPILLARMYLQDGKKAEAVRSLKTALSLKPDQPMGLFLLDEWRQKYPEMGL